MIHDKQNLVEVNIISKVQLPSFNGVESMINMNEYEYINLL